MFYNTRNGIVEIGNTHMDYISFGRGQKNLVMIPGLGDGLKTVKGKAAMMAVLFREYCKDYRVYIFSRKEKFAENYSTRDMAEDLRAAMEKIRIGKAHIIGISQGGMIAQYLAVDYPEVVDKLVLAVTLARQNETVGRVVKAWIAMAGADDYKNLFIDIIEKSYTEKYKKKYRIFYPVLTKIGKPKDYRRLIIQANAILAHDSCGEIENIKCRTLIIGADEDETVGINASREIHEKIAGSEMFIYKGYKHGVYEEARDFNKRILEFLKT